MHKDSLTPQLHPHLLHLVFFYEIHSNWCKVISHCGFDLHSLMISDVEHFFMHFFTIYMSSWGKCLFSFSIHFFLSLFFLFHPFFNWIVCAFATELYELCMCLDINPI